MHQWPKAFALCLMIWTLPDLVGFAAKYWFLAKHGFATAAGALSVNSLSLGQRLSFFRADLIFGVVLIPIGLVFFRALLPARSYWWFMGVVTGLAVVLQLLAFAELAILGNLAAGYGLLTEGLEWSIAHPKAALNYVMAYDLFRVLVTPVVLAVAAAIVIASTWPILKYHRKTIWKQTVSVVTVAWIVSVLLAVVAWFPWMRPTGYHEAMLWLSVRPFFESESDEGSYAGLPIGVLRSIYRDLANLQNVPDPVSPVYWGAAKDYDVMLFIMETGPAHLLSADPTFSDFPNLKRLSRSAWVGTRHYTTSPVSYKAVSSILLSMYPPSHNRTFGKEPPRLPGLIRSLHATGYQTGVYLPDVPGVYSRRENDFYSIMGPDRVSVPRESRAPESIKGRWQEAEHLDLASLRILEKDFRASAAAGRRFFGIYLPQLSHEPWVDVTGGQELNMARRRHNLMKVEDRHLGELIRTIENSGRLDHTLIVVTCDHGLRSSNSDSSFHEGQIDDLMFHVPFVFYAPGIVKERTNLSSPTSHIDIAPSILDLLGISEGRDFEAGVPIWNEALNDRCIFFWGSGYFASDGYECSGSFSMWNEMIDATYRSRMQHFVDSTTVPLDTVIDREIRNRIRQMGALRNAWYKAAVRALSLSRASRPAYTAETQSSLQFFCIN